MKKFSLCRTWLLGLLSFVAVACGEEGYHYPSVKLEFVTIDAGTDGRVQRLIPDKGDALKVMEDRTNSNIVSSVPRRVLSNYELVSSDGVSGAIIYSLQDVITPEPKLANDPTFAEGVRTDPVTVTSIWIGRNYLNMILNLKVKGGARHIFGIIEEAIEETDTEMVVTLSLLHDAGGDADYYNRRAYLSVPLAKYATEGLSKAIRIKFKHHTYDENGGSTLSDQYCRPGFEYVPDMN